MPLRYVELKDWLVALGIDEKLLNRGPDIPEMPNKLVTLTLMPGAGQILNGDADAVSFQVRVRSDTQDQDGAEAKALEIDRLLLNSPLPFRVDGARILNVTRTGGVPAALGPSDQADRFDYVCSYLVVIAH